MSTAFENEDLAVLVADLDMETAVATLLKRWQSLRIRSVSFRLFRHPRRDSGCRTNGCEFVRSFLACFSHALIVFDHEGSGREKVSAENVEEEVTTRLAVSGWGDRARAIVIAPELENWFWSDSPHVDSVTGWQGKDPALRTWLSQQGLWIGGCAKPTRPKEALQAALREVRKRPSPSLFSELAEKVSLERCVDPAFLRLVNTLQTWFPPAV